MPEKTRISFVYLARVKGADLHKIGVSSDPERRVSEFGPPCELVHTVETGAPKEIESALLDRFSQHVMDGEWIQCPESVPAKIAAEMDNQAESAPPPTEAPKRRRPKEPSPLYHGKESGYTELKRHAYHLARTDRRTYGELATELDVTENAVAKAVTTAGPKFQRLQMRIVELLSEFTVEREKNVHFELTPAPDTE
jgi:hypothetical protein